jgi:hypothetical protein
MEDSVSGAEEEKNIWTGMEIHLEKKDNDALLEEM